METLGFENSTARLVANSSRAAGFAYTAQTSVVEIVDDVPARVRSEAIQQ